MTDLTTMMVRQSLDSFVNLNAAQAKQVLRMDDEVDRYNNEMIEDVVQAMKRSPDLIEPGCRFSPRSATWSGSPTTPPTLRKTCCT